MNVPSMLPECAVSTLECHFCWARNREKQGSGPIQTGSLSTGNGRPIFILHGFWIADSPYDPTAHSKTSNEYILVVPKVFNPDNISTRDNQYSISLRRPAVPCRAVPSLHLSTAANPPGYYKPPFRKKCGLQIWCKSSLFFRGTTSASCGLFQLVLRMTSLDNKNP